MTKENYYEEYARRFKLCTKITGVLALICIMGLATSFMLIPLATFFLVLWGTCWQTSRYFYKCGRVLSLFQQCEKETFYAGSINEIQHHPSYKKIVAMGGIAIAVLLRELKTHQSLALVPLLEEITGESPLLPEHRGGGKVADIRSDWLAWGKENGYL